MYKNKIMWNIQKIQRSGLEIRVIFFVFLITDSGSHFVLNDYFFSHFWEDEEKAEAAQNEASTDQPQLQRHRNHSQSRHLLKRFDKIFKNKYENRLNDRNKVNENNINCTQCASFFFLLWCQVKNYQKLSLWLCKVNFKFQ